MHSFPFLFMDCFAIVHAWRIAYNRKTIQKSRAWARRGMPCVCRVAGVGWPDAQRDGSPAIRHTQGMPLRGRLNRPVRGTSCVDTALYFQDNTAKEGNI